ncbi:DUF3320 domain-containing protein [Sphingomonas sp. QA11]|uniref:DUF3320 domain-containing protein n=1 Tax=Sphingomonas sp. QA11 TaxID=2950605 RepID=UPI00234A8E80|nr:DUF3320 domain-containing protein [Sphingomonas sp. QA11]WCM27063.1 DUF3320 domain-containing protein [Sphingomonas sp. QA11]
MHDEALLGDSGYDRDGVQTTSARSIQKLFDDTRKRLVETGTRNRLVHVNRANTRGNVVNIANERSDNVWTILSSGKAMRFRALGHDTRRGNDVPDIVLANDDFEEADADRYTDNQLETRLGPDALAKKLLKIAREAKTAEEEQGVNILYLALGFLTWFEDTTSTVAREAPLILLPVELVRNARTSTYDVRFRDEDLITNLPLQQRLADDFGIRLPAVEVGENWNPSDYYAQVEGVITERARWKIDGDAMQLGFFSFSKLLMYLDLALDAWPDNALEGHALTRGLLYEGFDSEQPLFGPDDRLDDILPPEKMFHVVDADSSQARVIEEVRSGRNLVVQGPPGTGKSQTITNIIAAAAKEGKTVLFVAEKMAALSVVHDRLVKVGLRNVCLELHSKSANKKVVLAEVARTLGAAQAIPAMPQGPVALTETRDRLNRIAEALHAPIATTGETPFSALARQARYMGMNAPTPSFDADVLATMPKAQERDLANDLLEFGSLLQALGLLRSHPFWGVGALELQPVELARLKSDLTAAAVVAQGLRDALDGPLTAMRLPLARSLSTVSGVVETMRGLIGLPEGEAALASAISRTSDPARLTEALDTATAWRKLRDTEAAEFTEPAFDGEVASIRAPLVAGTGSFFARWGSAYRGASRQLGGMLRIQLPKSATDRVNLVDRLLEVKRLRTRWGDDEAFMSAALGEIWRGERTGFARVAGIARWVSKARDVPLTIDIEQAIDLGAAAAALQAMIDTLERQSPTTRDAIDRVTGILQLDPEIFDGGMEGVDLIDITARFSAMADSVDRYAEWARLRRLENRLAAGGVAALAARVAGSALDGNAAVIELKFARAERLWRDAISAWPELKEIGNLNRHALAQEFAGLERKRLKENVTTILAGHLGQVPQGAFGEMKIVRGEIGKRRAHIALRRLFEQAPAALQRIKPVLLMSPISVAQYLTPGRLSFDLLVIDEASQVRPEDALGAIARARQIVVVGDQKQLPPSSFFDRLVADDGENDEEDEEGEENLLGGAAALGSLESILSLCEARGLSSRMLQWHYRSRDPSLIRVSNREFYEDGLILPPSPLQEDPAYGLIFTKVDGVYDKGGKRDNRREGEAIIKRVSEHARANPDLSLGIVTFSSAQKNTITELLELARRTDGALDTFLREGQSEDLFVKNIENVQGDERDVILVSVGYGPTIAGGRLTSMSFGPVNGEGGERRLNVLFTRARIRCEVFASFDPGDIDASRVSREGPRILRRFLEFAKSGKLDDAVVTGEPADTPFEEDVADVIRSFGFLADPQVGSAGFRIDIGVRHPDKPGTYLLAVECDGATYHSALWARERDRLRQDVLEHLGWRFHRIWSTDWFYNRRAEIERLRAVLAEARDDTSGVRINGANVARPVSDDAGPPIVETFVVPPSVERKMPAYIRAHFPVSSHLEPHEVSMATLGPLAKRIVEVEGPICIEEVARRIAACFGREKAGRRILAVARQALVGQARISSELRSDNDFWFTSAQRDEPPVRDRSEEYGATLKADAISMLEIRGALAIARGDNAGGADADLIRSAARLLGFRRVGSDLQVRLTAGLEE